MKASVQAAIQAALSRNWENAIELNQPILKQNTNDIGTMNRLAYAYIQVGKIEEAKKIYREVLSLDQYNIIAKKNLDKINALPKTKKVAKKSLHPATTLSPSLFIEESGKTKIVSLINTAPASILSGVSTGDLVHLFPKRRSIEVRDRNNIYLGALPDDIAFHLLRLLRAGNDYQAWVKNATKNNISIFIREVKRGRRFLHQPSFITSLPETKHSQSKGIKTQKQDEERNDH